MSCPEYDQPTAQMQPAGGDWIEDLRRDLATQTRLAADRNVTIGTLGQENEKLREELAQYKQTYDLRWKSDCRAIKRWQQAVPGRGLTFPNQEDLCVWLLEQLESHPEKTSYAADAERWRSLVNCGRIMAHGSAGIGNPTGSNYAHITLSFWTVHPDTKTDPMVLQWLNEFVDIAARAQGRRSVCR